MANCQWINNKYVDLYKLDHCPYMRDGEGSTLGTSELKKIAKNRHFRVLCDDASCKMAGKQKILWIVENYMLSVGK